MKSNVLVDSNILVYASHELSEFFIRSQRFLRRQDVELFTTSKNLVEFWTAATRGNDPILTLEVALESLDFYRSQFTVLYPTRYSFLEFEMLLTKYRVKGMRSHDIEISAIGLANGISTIARAAFRTFNTDDFKNISEITLLTP